MHEGGEYRGESFISKYQSSSRLSAHATDNSKADSSNDSCNPTVMQSIQDPFNYLITLLLQEHLLSISSFSITAIKNANPLPLKVKSFWEEVS
jgi:hypothetical protein